MFYIFYLVTNKINGMIYKGHHQVEDLDIDDGYRGSGRYLKKAIEKYGKENFSRETLSVHNTRKEALEKEKEIVNAEFVAREDTYNLRGGGYSYEFVSEETCQKMSEAHKGEKNPMYGKRGEKSHMWGIKRSEETIQKMRESALKIVHTMPKETQQKQSKSLRGKKLSEEHKRKIGKANKLDIKVIKQRREDVDKELKVRGWISNLSRKWGLTPSGARYFISKYASILNSKIKIAQCPLTISKKDI